MKRKTAAREENKPSGTTTKKVKKVTEKQEKTRWGAVLCVFLASVGFSTGGLIMKVIPWSPLAINGARNLIGALVIGVYLLIRRHRIVISPSVIVGALCLILETTLFAAANKLTTAANAIVLQFTAPVFVILLMAVLFHVRPKKLDIITCFAVLFGVCLFFVDGIRAGNWLGNLTALLSGVCYAGVFMMNTGKNADALSSCFLGQLAAGLLLTPLCAAETDFSMPTITAMLILGTVQVGGSYILLSEGIRHTPPVTASLISGLEPIMNPTWVALFYGETISGLSIVGSVIVLGAILTYNLLMAKGNGQPDS